MEDISNEDEIKDDFNETENDVQDNSTENIDEPEKVEFNEDINTENDKLDNDIVHPDIPDNDDENNENSESLNRDNGGKRMSVDAENVDTENVDTENVDAEKVEAENVDEENVNVDVESESHGEVVNNDDETKPDILDKHDETEEIVENTEVEVLEIIEESSQDFVYNLLSDIITSVYQKCEGISENLIESDIEYSEYREFEPIEEVNEPVDLPEDDVLHEDDRENEVQQTYPEETEKLEIEEEDGDEGEEEDEEENIANEFAMTREQLIMELKNAESEKIALFEKNTSFQHKLGEYLRRKKVEQPAAPITDTKDVIDFEQKYIKLMESLKELEEKYEVDSETFKEEIEELKSKTLMNEDHVQHEKDRFKNYRFAVAQKSVNTRTGKSISQKEMEELNAMEEKKEAVVVEIRLESIKLQNEVNKSDAALKSKEELADGLHLIDFEQFKIENQSYNEKLEERTEDLLKLRKKITSNVHVLTHVKEKLEFVKSECAIEARVLQEIDEKMNKSRDNLTGLKQSRDRYRILNEKMKRSSGMLGNRDLLRNYEDCVDTVEVQVQKMNDMKNRQLRLGLRNQALQMKIENTKKADAT